MDGIQKLRNSPLLARVAPFFVFVVLTAGQGQFGEASKYWFYFAKSVVGAWLLWVVWPVVLEMRWKISWEAVVVGIVIFAVWIGLDPYYPKWVKADKAWNPHAQFGAGTALAWFFVVVRFVGITLVVPPLEEVFYRSFIYRYIVSANFTAIPLKQFDLRAFVVTAALFGVVHREWLAGIICGAAYQWLVLRKDRLGDAMTAHAITNFLLSAWVVYKGAWQFW